MYRKKDRIIARDRAEDLRPFQRIHRFAGCGSAARNGLEHDQVARRIHREHTVCEHLNETLLHVRLGLFDRCIAISSLRGQHLHKPQFFDVARDGRLRHGKPVLTKNAGKLLLRFDILRGDQARNHGVSFRFHICVSLPCSEHKFAGIWIEPIMRVSPGSDGIYPYRRTG